jgi:phosphotransferase system  glucose/maltose/N-acetylglucosamine-specific IIC component
MNLKIKLYKLNMVSELILGIIIGTLIGMMTNIWNELLFRWWDNYHPESNKYIVAQLVITTIVILFLIFYLYHVALTYEKNKPL